MGGRDRRELAAIFAGGAVGAVARVELTLLGGPGAPQWPWGTFAANVIACLLLGYFSSRLLERLPLSAYRRPLLGTGLCGALSTFSTVQVEVLKMLDAHAYGLAVGYGTATLAAGYGATHLSSAFARRVKVIA
ncbi:MAG TPA: fluoride efflux transporter CrcB [Baekduia sp.]|uniref:fluoride efflux transporter CrcB n=1 Tax=Baekduia sp. TaxID=2600305 RepID=UPI002D77FBB9|nr:fluoride efflux transporter CrcB [Baekduia sp.]HET6506950.1 fluoride efflux transporter CrcB [Baekduia sp.]